MHNHNDRNGKVEGPKLPSAQSILGVSSVSAAVIKCEEKDARSRGWTRAAAHAIRVSLLIAAGRQPPGERPPKIVFAMHTSNGFRRLAKIYQRNLLL